MRDVAKQGLPIGALLAVGVVGLLAGPKLASIGRKTAHKATGLTYRSGVVGPRPNADPANGVVT